MVLLARSVLALEECKDHVLASNLRGSQIEFFLAQHILVVMCAEMQQEIHRLLRSRLSGACSSECSSFISEASKKLLRSVRTNELSGFIGLFSQEAKRVFLEKLDDRITLQYNTAVGERHLVAHGPGAQLTLGDLEYIVSHATAVLQAADDAFSHVV